MKGKLEGVLTMLSPLSHIGESHGPDSYLDTQYIIGLGGRPVETFVYHGNAFRGMLRDKGAKYFLDRIGDKVQVPLDVFYLLFSGGNISGDQSIDIDQARKIRQSVPIISIFGGGVGNQILPGKLQIGDGYPLCSETKHLIPEQLRNEEAVSWRVMTTERSFSRVDDAKNENLNVYLIDSSVKQLETGEQIDLLGQEEEKPKKKKEQPQQMRYTIEVLAAGTQLWFRIDLLSMSELEFGALMSCFAEWSQAPYIGGQNRIGMGRVSASFDYYSGDGTKEHLLDISHNQIKLGPTAEKTKDLYDRFLDQYALYLADNDERLVRLLDGKTAS